MPYLLVSTQIRLEIGPTFVGDGKSDKSLMAKLDATPSKQLGNEFSEYVTNLAPREVLNLLEKEGWKVIATISFNDMVQQATLIKIAGGTFLLGSTGLYLAQKWVQNKVRNLPHYKETLKIIAEHDKAREALGQPIQVGAVDLADNRHNYVGKQKSVLRIPLTGSIDCGHADVIAFRNTEKEPFITALIKLSLQAGTVTIYDNQTIAVEDLLASD